MHDYTAPTRTANEIMNLAARTSFWNHEGRTDEALLTEAYTAASQFGLTEDTMNELIEAAWAGRTGTHEAYIATARQIISAA